MDVVRAGPRIPEFLASLVVLCAVSSATPTVQAKSPGFSARPDSQGITHGAPVDDCAWPAAGILIKRQGSSYSRCGAVYIGGRVIVTAAHCLNGPFWFNVPCEDDGDCPDLSTKTNGEVDVTCEENPLDPTSSRCVDTSPNADNQANNPDYVRFGSIYSTSGADNDSEIRKSVQIEYCRAVNIDTSPSGDDFAYCLLSEAPNIEPVPIAVPCEVDAEMLEGTMVYAVGHGRCITNNGSSGGTKRWASADLEIDLTSTSTMIGAGYLPQNWATDPIDDCNVADDDTGSTPIVIPTDGDSGSGLYTALSDGTWRLIGIAVSATPAYASVWQHIDFMLDDANISEDDIIPCHDSNLDWEGGAACTASPSAPDEASGRWERGTRACQGDTTTRTNICPSSLKPSSPAPASDLSLIPGNSYTSGTSERSTSDVNGRELGCGVANKIAPPAALGFVVFLMLRGSRRRKR